MELLRMKTVKETHLGKTVLRLVDTSKLFVGLAVVDDAVKLKIEGEAADEVWRRLHDEVGKTNPRYLGFAGARNRFFHFFPNGFHSSGYETYERAYKVAARARLLQSVPLAGAAEGSGFGEAVLPVFRATNLLSPFEKTRL
jgi:hypothetical protein